VTTPEPDERKIDSLVDNMFRDVFTDEERAELVERIKVWEVDHPGLTPSQRISGWIDLAYDFQAGR
jgi:hypothetical protein